MCGISGVISPDGVDLDTVRKMSDVIAHRGPDDAGVQVWPDHGVGLGHRRLSIIDLSLAGRNPMTNEDGTVWIVFNGEIYNFQDLRLELERAGHTFRSNTDTEVIIHAYEEWGDEHIHRLRGMFAYALYDRRPHIANGRTEQHHSFRLLLVRDRVGIKPLFYYWYNHTFLYASEIKAILAYPGVNGTLDRTAIFDYLTYLYIPAPKTAYTHIRKLPAGHFLIFENEHVCVRQYWDVPLDNPSPVHTFDQAIEMVQETLTRAVRLHIVADVPVGVFLSGGLDSSTVTALMAQAVPEPIRTFSIGFDVAAHSETHYARLVADQYQTQHYERIVGYDSVRRMLPFVVEMYDEPYADSSAIPTYRVSVVAREQVKVVLSGDGGDEVFAGYNWYTGWLRLRPFDAVPFSVRRRLLPVLGSIWPERRRGKGFVTSLAMDPLAQYARLLELFSPAEKRQILAPEWTREFNDYDDYWYFRQYWHDELDPMTCVQYLDLKTYLPGDILTKVDRASMAVSLEVRPALLDHVLIERLFSIPTKFRAPNGRKKHLMKHATKNILPEAILNRPKKGFSVPWVAWMQTEGEWVERQLRSIDSLGVFQENVTEVPNLLDRGIEVWALLLLQQWLLKQ
jgi:asparagine synthase (glutamine-hydrolysing)